MKVTKTELKEMIRTVIKEELSNTVLKEEKEFRSEYARLMSTPEGREKYFSLPYEEQNELRKADRAMNPVARELDALDDFRLEYDGFEYEWFEDHFDPGRWHGHYQTSGTDYHDDFIYKVDPSTMFETMRDNIIPKFASKYPTDKLLSEYNKLDNLFQNAGPEEEDKLGEACDLFLAQNLESFVDLFLDEVTEYFSEDANDWANKNW